MPRHSFHSRRVAWSLHRTFWVGWHLPLEERNAQRRIDSDQKECRSNRKDRGAKIQQRRDDPDPQEDVDVVRTGPEDVSADGTLEPVGRHRKPDEWANQIHFMSPEGEPICCAG
jgi:hypothetical protein